MSNLLPFLPDVTRHKPICHHCGDEAIVKVDVTAQQSHWYCAICWLLRGCPKPTLPLVKAEEI